MTPVSNSARFLTMAALLALASAASAQQQAASGIQPTPCGCQAADQGFYVGADYLFVRPRFSEAVAFAQGTQTPTSFQVDSQELGFKYDSAMRAEIGYRFDDGQSAIQFTYMHIDGETWVNGTASKPGQFIADPFGNIVGSVVVVNPSDARFGTTLTGGDAITTMASVRLNVYDADFIRALPSVSTAWDLRWSAGVRFAQVDEYYDSIITLGAATLTRGDYSASFSGVGPRFGFEAERYFGEERRFSIFANTHASLLFGEYGTASGSTVVPLGFSARENDNQARAIPVFEMEAGAAWHPLNHLSLSAGWLFQSWFDLGTSGGTFGGFYTVQENSNIMSFDGLFARAEWKF